MTEHEERGAREQESWKGAPALKGDDRHCATCGQETAQPGKCLPLNYGTADEPVVCYLCPDCLLEVDKYATS